MNLVWGVGDCNLPNKHKKVVIEPVIKKGKFQFVYAVIMAVVGVYLVYFSIKGLRKLREIKEREKKTK